MMGNSLNNKQNLEGKAATGSTPKPGDFPLRSAESRAAARVMLRNMEEPPKSGQARVSVITPTPPAGWDVSKQYTGRWRELSDGRLVRFIYVPRTMAKDFMEGMPIRVWFSSIDKDEVLEAAREDELSKPRPQKDSVFL